MPWIELHQTVWSHRKTVALAEALDLDDTYAAAHVSRLWCWALDNAIIDHDGKRGLLTGMSARTIATGAGWKGDQDGLVAALFSSGYLEQDGDDVLLHDWWDYAGKYLDKREKNAARMRAARAKDDDQPSAPHVQNTSRARAGATVPNLTVPEVPTANRAVGAPAGPVAEPATTKKRRGTGGTGRGRDWIIRDPLYAPLVALFGRPSNRECSGWGMHIASLTEKEATPEEVPRRAANFPLVMPDRNGKPCTMTLAALDKHWHLCATVPTISQNGGHDANLAKQREADRRRELQRKEAAADRYRSSLADIVVPPPGPP